MPEYYNVIQASKYIGADPKTVRRWLKQGKMTGTRTDRGWLAIPEDQVERMRIEWENERTRFSSLDVDTKDSLDISTRVEALEQRVASLEQALSNASLPVPAMPHHAKTPNVTTTQQSHQKRDAVPSDLPADTLSAYDFATQHGIDREHFKNYMRRGVDGEMLEITEVKHHSRAGYTLKFLTPSQQEQAIEVLKRHGKIQ